LSEMLKFNILSTEGESSNALKTNHFKHKLLEIFLKVELLICTYNLLFNNTV